MKKRILAFMLAALVAMSVLFILGGCDNSGDTDVTVATESTADEAVTEVSSPDESGAVIEEIMGFTNDSFIKSMTFPYKVDDGMVTLTAVGSYTGAFVEDGTDEPVENIMAIVLQNTSGKPIQQVTVNFKGSDGTEYRFEAATLPKGTSALVMEIDRRTYDDKATFSEVTAEVNFSDGFVSTAQDMSLFFADDKLNIINQSDNDYRIVYVRYKNFTQGNVFLGGITYNVSFDNVLAGNSYDYETGHYISGRSVVMMIQAVE